ncbi:MULTISPECIES: MOSC domain-containing protein [unclassified Streptomyces]|uniref:MOSC domain-containing protein n=1 Tax=unclassified Streptomyces TaxID=2593676 RepID=UPI003D8E5997
MNPHAALEGGESPPFREGSLQQAESYAHWRRVFCDDLEFGHFGENFTIDGLPADEVCIGTATRSAKPYLRSPDPATCYRVGMRLNEPRMASLTVVHRRPGFYFRVITEGG